MSVLIIATHPVYYHIPFYRALATLGCGGVEVLFCDTQGLSPMRDPGFGDVEVVWNLPLLNGYNRRFLSNFAPRRQNRFVNSINPGLPWAIFESVHSIVLVQGYSKISNLFAILVCVLLRKTVFFRGEATVSKVSPESREKWKTLLLPSLFRIFARVFFSCSGNRMFFERFGVPVSKLVYLPCHVDNELYHEMGRQGRAQHDVTRMRLGIPLDAVVVVSAGKLIGLKRMQDVLLACAMTSYRPYLLLVGDGAARTELEKLAESLGYSGLRISGYQRPMDVPLYIGAADIFALVSERDNSPKILNEAMNCGVPVLVSEALGTASDLVEHGRNGFIVPVGDIAQMVAALEAMSDPAVRSTFGRLSRSKVSEFTAARCAEIFSDVCDMDDRCRSRTVI